MKCEHGNEVRVEVRYDQDNFGPELLFLNKSGHKRTGPGTVYLRVFGCDKCRVIQVDGEE